ncbi:hypothetical protein Barb6XT_01255 [Bacteroidales bacterium Barb6XT]|nr:hypothetical protein Barb6XT_01333 [Bacteroidales bacterium Barb6XT]OAV67928.1 hypothetical protein Barb6XT_01255 [Bacteroidales bacterium Barb6XT]
MELYKTGLIDLRFAGESHFGLTPNVPYARQHKDRPVLLPAAKGKRLSVSGLMNPDCRRAKTLMLFVQGFIALCQIFDLFLRLRNTLLQTSCQLFQAVAFLLVILFAHGQMYRPVYSAHTDVSETSLPASFRKVFNACLTAAVVLTVSSPLSVFSS